MTNYFKIWTELLQTLKSIGDNLTFTGGAINVDVDAPDALYGDERILPESMPDQAIANGVVIKAHEDNVSDIVVNGFALGAGESVPIEIDNLNKVIVTGDVDDIYYYLGS